MASTLQVKGMRRRTDARIPTFDWLGGSNPVNPHGIVGSVSHVMSGTLGRYTVTDAGTATNESGDTLTIDQLLHTAERVIGMYPDGTSYVVEKKDITVDEANNRIEWTRIDNGEGLEIIIWGQYSRLGITADKAAGGS